MSHSTPASDGPIRPDGTTYPAFKKEEAWKSNLTESEYQVLRESGTEPAFTGEYTDNKETGIYSCRACGFELFTSDTKFDSRCGWPSFYQPVTRDRVVYLEDSSLGRTRTEVRCANCGGHLGHVFEGEGFDTPTDLRYCINSISVRFDAPPHQSN